MNTYFNRYAYPSKLFKEPPVKQLKISVVIPCYNEPDIISSLSSLNDCTPITGTEVLVIVNEAENCNLKITEQNKKTILNIKNWQSTQKLNFNLLVHYLIAPKKDAGVGFARKVGMDEAARRFETASNTEGVICCFDADSTCSRNYLQTIYNNFYSNNQKPHGAAIYFEHPIPKNERHATGIIQYELHLRYYVQSLRYIGYPYAYHTIGSSMAVRSDIYQKVGGMNKRKAGEDFYFLHRVMPTGNFIDISDAIIYPSPRISDRVPFGTGKAMEKWSTGKSDTYFTYNIQSFLDLRILFKHLEDFYENNYEDLALRLPESIQTYLDHTSFNKAHQRLVKQSTSLKSFINNWHQYFDGFRVLKYLHFARDNYYEDAPVLSQAEHLARLSWDDYSTIGGQAIDWLNYYRRKDKAS